MWWRSPSRGIINGTTNQGSGPGCRSGGPGEPRAAANKGWDRRPGRCPPAAPCTEPWPGPPSPGRKEQLYVTSQGETLSHGV